MCADLTRAKSPSVFPQNNTLPRPPFRSRAVGSEGRAALNVPLIPASNFIIGSGREYSHGDGTPTWEALEAKRGGLESGQLVAFASGLAAIAVIFDQLMAGSVVILPDDCYKGLQV